MKKSTKTKSTEPFGGKKAAPFGSKDAPKAESKAKTDKSDKKGKIKK